VIRLLNGQAGFSLLEVLVAMTVLSIIVIGFMNFFTDSISFLFKNQATMQEMNEGQKKLEERIYNNEADIAHNLEFKFGSQKPIEVKGGTVSSHGLTTFLPSVPAFISVIPTPESYIYGNAPDNIDVKIKTQNIIDKTKITVKLKEDENSNDSILNTSILMDSNNQDKIAYLDIDNGVSAGWYKLEAKMEGKESAILLDYHIKSVNLVAVGDQGTILTSYAGDKWYNHSLESIVNLKAVTWGGETDYQKFVTVGEGGVIYSSADGVNWDKDQIADSSGVEAINLNGVAWGRDRFVAVGDNGVILESRYNDISKRYSDWTRAKVFDDKGTLVTENFKNIIYKDSDDYKGFVIVGEKGIAYKNSKWDSIIWNFQTFALTKPLYNLIWNQDENKFIAVGEGQIPEYKYVLNDDEDKFSLGNPVDEVDEGSILKDIEEVKNNLYFIVGNDEGNSNSVMLVYKKQEDEFIKQKGSYTPQDDGFTNIKEFNAISLNSDGDRVLIVGTTKDDNGIILAYHFEDGVWQWKDVTPKDSEEISTGISFQDITYRK